MGEEEGWVGVRLSRLSDTWASVAATRSRNAKRDAIAEVLAEATSDEIEIVVSYLGGSLRQRRTGLGWRSLAELPPPAEAASLSVVETDAAFDRIAGQSGSGSAAARAALATDLFGRATDAEQAFLRGLVFGDLRQGALDAVVQDALAVAYGAPVAQVRRAAMLLSSTSRAARLLATDGVPGLAAVTLEVGTAVQPMLAASAPDPARAAERLGLPALADAKLDGIRVQVHRRGADVAVFTRSLDEITDRMPEVVHAVLSLPVASLVLDGEVLALGADGRPEPFQLIAARTASHVDLEVVAGRLPVRAFFFDLLHVDGRDLLDAPLEERVTEMDRLLEPDQMVPRTRVSTLDELEDAFAQTVAGGFEGVVLKDLGSGYAAGRRASSWVKVKPRHTFDLVVIAAEWGHGRRRGWLSNLHLAALDPSTGEPVMLGKTFKGLTDQMLAWQTERFLQLETSRTPGTVQLRPELVVEIACDGLQRSSRYPGGVALRFARVLRYRPDKHAADADTIDTVRRLGVGAVRPAPD